MYTVGVGILLQLIFSNLKITKLVISLLIKINLVTIIKCKNIQILRCQFCNILCEKSAYQKLKTYLLLDAYIEFYEFDFFLIT